MAAKREDSRPWEQIAEDIARHLSENPAFRDRAEIIDKFLMVFAQDPMTETAPVVDDEMNPEDVVDETGPGD